MGWKRKKGRGSKDFKKGTSWVKGWVSEKGCWNPVMNCDILGNVQAYSGIFEAMCNLGKLVLKNHHFKITVLSIFCELHGEAFLSTRNFEIINMRHWF